MMELYQMHGPDGRKIEYYSPVENAKEFWLTPYPAPKLKYDDDANKAKSD